MRKRLYIVLLSVLSIAMILLTFTYTEKVKADSSARYTQKIVSVVYDDSGSMSTDDRQWYANYSLKMLISLLNDEDTLDIIRMNNNNVYSIDLKSDDRQGEVDKITQSNGFCGTGTTPYTSIKRAINQLVSRGMKTTDKVVETDATKEYWLVILTDGVFADSNSNAINETDLVKALSEDIEPYSGLNTIFMGIGNAVPNLTDSDLVKNYAFTAYACENADGVVSMMNDVANQITGKVGLSDVKKAAVDVSSKTVTIDFDKIGMSVRRISITVQETFKTNNNAPSVKSVKYKGQEVSYSNSVMVSQNISSSIYMRGSSVQIESDDLFTEGKMVIEYSGDVDGVSVLVEPALTISPYIKYYDGSAWVKSDMQYVNSHFTKGDIIKVNYDIIEDGNGNIVDINSLFGNYSVSIKYDGKPYNVDDEISLEIGRKEIVVSISIMDGVYYLSKSMMCVVLPDPTSYRVESDNEETTQTNTPNYDGSFTIYKDNKPITKSESSEYNYEATVTSPDGTVKEVTPTVDDNGKLNVDVDFEDGVYGEYIIDIKVTAKDPDAPFTRTIRDIVHYYPTNLNIYGSGDYEKTITSHKYGSEELKYKFNLLADGTPIGFDNSLFSYKVKVNGKEVKNGISVNSDELVYLLDYEEVNLDMINGGTISVEVEVESKNNSSLKASGTLSTTVTPSIINIESYSSTEKSDIYDFSSSKAYAYFKVTRDGEYLSADELQEYLDKKVFKTKWNGFSPLGKLELNVETIDGNAVYVYRVKGNSPKWWNWLWGSWIFKEKTKLTVSFNGIESDAEFLYTTPTFGTRVIRYGIFVLIGLILFYITVYVIGFFQTYRMLPSGIMVKITPDHDEPDDNVRVETRIVNDRKKRIMWYLKRLRPDYLFKKPQDNVNLFSIKLFKDKRTSKFRFREDLTEVTTTSIQGFDTYLTNINRSVRYRNCVPPTRITITNRNFINQVRRTSRKHYSGDTITVSNTAMAHFDADNNNELEYVIFFVYRNL